MKNVQIPEIAIISDATNTRGDIYVTTGGLNSFIVLEGAIKHTFPEDMESLFKQLQDHGFYYFLDTESWNVEITDTDNDTDIKLLTAGDMSGDGHLVVHVPVDGIPEIMTDLSEVREI